jgi:hypothetical protein
MARRRSRRSTRLYGDATAERCEGTWPPVLWIEEDSTLPRHCEEPPWGALLCDDPWEELPCMHFLEI